MRRETRWVFEGEGPFESSPVLAGDTLYLTGRDRYLYAIRAEDGKLRFRTCLGVFGDSAAAPAVVGQVVVVGTNRGELVGVETGSGAVVWRRDTGSAVVADLVADPDGSRVFGTLANGKVLAFRPADGLAIWSRDTRAAPSSGPALGKSLVYVGSYERKALVALDPAEGREVWSAPVGGPVSGPAVVGGDLVCFGSDDHDVYAVDTKTGGARRPFALTSMVKARPAVDGAAVYCGAMDGRFFCFPLTASGPAAWQKDLGHAVLATPALCAGRIYVGTTGGELYCLDAKKGTTEWIFPTGGKIVSRPLVRNQTVYLSSMDGRVYAIRQ
jgi:outer membrane protein assembly factor BamB